MGTSLGNAMQSVHTLIIAYTNRYHRGQIHSPLLFGVIFAYPLPPYQRICLTKCVCVCVCVCVIRMAAQE